MFAFVFGLAVAGAAQGVDLQKVNDLLDKGETVTLDAQKVKLSKFDFKFENRNVEVVLFEPIREGKHPGVLLIPGYMRTARDYMPLGVRLAGDGFVCVSVTQPGWGKSEGKSDFVGPTTIRTLEAAFDRLKSHVSVEPSKLGLFGYSRGAMAASILATRLPDLKAAVLGAGIYDFKKAYDEVKLDGIKKNMEDEATLGHNAVKERSSIQFMDQLKCPLLILHGEKDENAPVSQSKALAEKLKELGKEFEMTLYADADHGLPLGEMYRKASEFFKRKLK